jgi:hypothetical protein
MIGQYGRKMDDLLGIMASLDDGSSAEPFVTASKTSISDLYKTG